MVCAPAGVANPKASAIRQSNFFIFKILSGPALQERRPGLFISPSANAAPASGSLHGWLRGASSGSWATTLPYATPSVSTPSCCEFLLPSLRLASNILLSCCPRLCHIPPGGFMDRRKQQPPTRELQEWITAWNNTYRRLRWTPEQVNEFYRVMSRRWGFTATELEVIPPKERACLAQIRYLLITQANRLTGNRVEKRPKARYIKPDPIAASYLGGRPRSPRNTVMSL